ncbi:alpha-2-macroglobulin-like protein 1 isoform X1 [Chrysemys picta bellii]|uniref:alpha-2-macroglobulin-like protein 1 isoform X1 n=1 Tax=Chrysemys picta bellii TaxID=8478 RepID=UPI0032B2B81E
MVGSLRHSPVSQMNREGCLAAVADTKVYNLTLQNSYQFSLDAVASLEESGTGLEFNATQSCRVTSSVITLQFLDNNIYYQPGAPYHGRLKLNSANGMPLKNTEVFLAVYRGKMQSETYLNDHTGVTSFTLDTSPWRDSDKQQLSEDPPHTGHAALRGRAAGHRSL